MTNNRLLFGRYADTSVVSSLVLHGKSVSDIELLSPNDPSELVSLGLYTGRELVMPNLALLEFLRARTYRPPAEEKFREYFCACGLIPAECGVTTYWSSLDYRYLSRSMMDMLTLPRQREELVEAFMHDTYDLMITAEAYSAGACLVTMDAKFGTVFELLLRKLEAHVYVPAAYRPNWIMAARRKAQSSERSSATNARPSRADTISSCRGMRPRGTTCAGRCISSRRTGAGGAARTRGRPATISS